MGVAPAVTRVKGTGGRSCRILFSRLLLRVCLVAEARLSYQVADNPTLIQTNLKRLEYLFRLWCLL
jgi:hypothetical protein